MDEEDWLAFWVSRFQHVQPRTAATDHVVTRHDIPLEARAN
jgi:hypothetical protein